ncbi:MAG TPA: Wzz/FepE/Etk N-terminal domain-containing protein, partial [Gemmatimonadales bacterium]|nr:Wzz/FepE/Etk N-terminal domain-containing protein [Gemmatimonadales bacterium]
MDHEFESHSPPGSVSLRQMFGVLRRHYRIVLALTVLGAAAGGLLVYKEPATYEAMATLRLAGERRALTGQIEGPTPDIARTTDPLLSLAELVKSRAVIGEVVDSLGLRLVSGTPEFATSSLDSVQVDSQATRDTIHLAFYQNGVKAILTGKEARAPYGQPISLGGVRFAVISRPDVSSAGLYVIPRDMAIDGLLADVGVYQRAGTDIIDVMYSSKNPRMAQRVVNTTILSFQRLNILTAKQKSQRRRQFLEEQQKQTDSLLARVQADLAAFRSRQQLASSQNALDAQQTSLLTLESRRAELEADRSTFAALLAQIKKGGAAGESEALRALAAAPGVAENPTVGDYFRRLENYQYRLDSMTTGPWQSAPTNPDLVQLKSLIASVKGQLRQAVSSHIATLDARIVSLRDLTTRTGSRLQVLPAMAEEEARLTSRVQTLTATSDQVRQEYQKARMAEEVEAGDVDIVSLADTPYAPMLGAAPLKLSLGLLLGFLLGTGGAFLLEAMNTSVRRPEDLDLARNVPGLAVIPRLTASAQPARRLGGLLGPGKKGEAGGSERSLGAVSQPFSVGLEAFRMLRTSLIWCEQGDRMKTLVVTSAAPGEGKTLTAANLAVTFAYDGLRVLLIDCDVRRPKLHGLFQISRAPGLMELLTPASSGADGVESLSFDPGQGLTESGRAVSEVIRTTKIRGLWVLPC